MSQEGKDWLLSAVETSLGSPQKEKQSRAKKRAQPDSPGKTDCFI